jgi:hypothetical protein
MKKTLRSSLCFVEVMTGLLLGDDRSKVLEVTPYLDYVDAGKEARVKVRLLKEWQPKHTTLDREGNSLVSPMTWAFVARVAMCAATREFLPQVCCNTRICYDASPRGLFRGA